MDRWLSKIVALLDGEDRDARRAAARVLAALKPGSPEVVEALGRALASEDRRLRSTCLNAVDVLGALPAFPDVAKLLREPGDIGHRAMEVIAGMGPKALSRLKKRFDAAGEAERRRILSVAARLRGAGGFDIIVRALDRGHADQVLELGRRLAEELAQAKPRDRATLVRRLEKFLGAGSKNQAAAAAGAALDLLARVLGSDARTRLIAYAEPMNPPHLRQRALDALARLAPEANLRADELSRLISFLGDRDYTHVVAPTMALLERAKLAAVHAGPLLSCLRGDDPALRRFAATALGQVDTARSAGALLEVLQGENPDLQKRAAVSLSRQSASIPLVVSALCRARDAKNAWVLARILHPHAHRLKPEHVAKLANAAVDWLVPGDPRAEAIVTVLRDHNLHLLEEAGLKRIKRLKKERKAGEIVNLIRPLIRDGQIPSAKVRYELALAEIVRGRKDVVRQVRLENAGLAGLEPLLHEPDFPLLTLLKREKSWLEPDEYYLIGCHFAERPFLDRAFGGEILRWLVRTFPDQGSAQSAANKLVMEGFPPPPRPRRKRAPASARKKAAPRKKPAAKKKAAAQRAAPKKAAARKAPGKKAARKKSARKRR